jgi:signal transduction histidine kinase
MSPQQRTQLLRALRSSTDRLRRLAADLSSAAESAADATAPLELEDVSLTDMVRRAAARIQAAGVDVPISVDVAEETVFPADPGRLDQILDNLLNNAVRHGSPPIGILAEVGSKISVRVTDSGPGVPSELEPSLFERFAASALTGGTGLGLYIVREIAKRHGGDVLYHPPVDGQPTTFELTLPRPSWRE